MLQGGLRKLSMLLGPLFLLAGLTGCAGDDDAVDPTATAQILTFEVDAVTLTEGESTTLRWSTKHALAISLIANGYVLPDLELGLDGELEISPLVDTTYRLEAKGKDGTWTYRDVALEVTPFGPPVVDRFEASKLAVGKEGEVELSWSVRGASEVSIVEGNGRRVGSGLEREGTTTVQPTKSTVYLLQARNLHGSATSEVAISVARPPSVALRSDRQLILFGDEIELSWTVSDAESLVIEDPLGEVIHEGPGTDGNLALAPEMSGLFRAVARGIGGESISSTLISIRPVIDSFTVTVQGQARVGGQALVEWETRGAESVTVYNSAGESRVLDGSSGQQAVPVGAGGGFILRAARGAHSVEARAMAEVSERPLIFNLDTRGLVTAGQGESGVATVLWHVDGASRLLLEVEPGGIVDLVDKSPRKDEADVLFIGPGIVRLTAFNSAGQTVMEIPTPVDPVPTVTEFFAAPSRVGMGESVDIHWTTLDAQKVILEKDGVNVGAEPTLVNGSFPIPILSTQSTYVLRIFNGLGFEVVSEPLVVEVGAPNALSLMTTDGRTRYPIGTTIGLQWTNDGGTELTLRDGVGGREIYSTNDALEIRKGGWEVTLPKEQVVKTYVVEVSNASGTDSMELEVQAVTGPIIEEFYSEFDEITERDTLVFFWNVTADADGNIPTLALEDNKGNTYPMDDIEDPLEGWKRFRIGDWEGGDYVFTLSATTPNPPTFELSHPVTVYGIPIVDLIEADPPFAEEEGDEIGVSWQTTHGVSMEVFLIDRSNQIAGDAVFATDDEATTIAGNTTIQPSIANPNIRLLVKNPLGRETAKDFRIGVNPATVVSLTANGVDDPNGIDLLAGEELTLEWETTRSTERYFNVGRSHFMDLSDSLSAIIPTGRVGTEDSGEYYIDFPTGFTFPFGDREVDQIILGVDGWTSFGYTSKPASTRSTTWPNPSVHAHLIPFQADLYQRNAATVHWDRGEDPRYGRYLVFQYTNWEFWSSSFSGSDLNFQVVLFEDGAFEYRYGNMSTVGTTASNPRPYDGQDVQVAFQYFGGDEGRWIKPPSTPTPGGLSSRVFSPWLAEDTFYELAPEAGSITFVPELTTEYRLFAKNGHSEHEVAIPVRVHPKGHISVWSDPAEPKPGVFTTLHWEAGSLTSLQIEDASTGTIIYTAAPHALAAGSYSLGPLPEGIYEYVFHAVGLVDWDQFSEEFTLSVHDTFSLDFFEASETLVKVTEVPVTLSWETLNGVEGTITTNDGDTIAHVTGSQLASGSIEVFPTKTTTYFFDVESHKRYRQASITVQVRTVWIDDVSTTKISIPSGGQTDISWSFSGPGHRVSPPVMIAKNFNPIEVSNDSPFVDISSTGTAISTSFSASSTFLRDFPDGFVFPFFYDEVKAFRVTGTGDIRFVTDVSTWEYTPVALPDPDMNHVNLAVYWGDMTTNSGATIHMQHFPGDDEHLVIQWTNLKPWSEAGNLTFQVALFADGDVEYRYGPMSTAASSGLENGIGFVIGLQSIDGEYGITMHGGAGELAGGVSGRSWRFPLAVEFPQSGTASVSLKKSRTFKFCIEDEDWLECEDLDVTVYFPGDIQITEMMMEPLPGQSQWVEIRNLLPTPIELDQWILSTTNGPSLLDGHILPGGGYLTVARSSTAELTPDIIAPGLVINPPGDTLELLAQDLVLSTITFDSSWSFSPGVSKEIDPIHLKTGIEERLSSSEFCDSATPLGAASFGSPGSHPDSCSLTHYNVDFSSPKRPLDVSGLTTSLGLTTYLSYMNGHNLGFDFPFYGTNYSSVSVSSCGYVAFGNLTASGWSNGNFPSSVNAAVNGIIAAFWDDLNPTSTPGSIEYAHVISNGLNVGVFVFNKLKQLSGTTPGVSFQLELWENGEIAVHYLDLVDEALSRGSSATLGIQAPTSQLSDYVRYSHNEDSVVPGQTIVYSPK